MVLTWMDFKTLTLKLVASSDQLGFRHPLDENPCEIDAGQLTVPEFEEIVREAINATENNFTQEWKDSDYFLVGRQGLIAALEKIKKRPWRYLIRDGDPFWPRLQQEIILTTFANEDNLCLLNLHVGPVQEFIGEARKVRDLWTGSYILAAATFRAAKPIIEQYGPDSIIHPHLHETVLLLDEQSEDWRFYPLSDVTDEARMLALVPNRIMAIVPMNKVQELTKQALAHLKGDGERRGYWPSLADSVWSRLHHAFKKDLDKTQWEAQISDHFGLFYTATPIARSGLTDGYHQFNRDAQTFFQERKLTRSFSPWPSGAYQMKCTLCAHREAMGPVALSHNRSFWVKAVHGNKGRLRPGERLCAVCLTKRLLGHPELGVQIPRFESTSDIAVQKYRVSLGQIDHEALLAAANSVLAYIGREAVTAVDDIPGDWLYAENLDPKKFLGDEAIVPVMDLPVQDGLSRRLEKFKEELAKIERQTRSKAPRYYAILMMDGDDIGKWMSGEKPESRLYTLMRHSAISHTLADLGRRVMPHVLADWTKIPVYSGGDDLLAMGTVAGALEIADRLSQAFSSGLQEPSVPGLGLNATISAGLVLVHHHVPLGESLEHARLAVQLAKETLGKDSLAIAVKYSSGSYILGGYTWNIIAPLAGINITICDFVRTLASWMALEPEGLSPQFVYRVIESLGVFYEPDPPYRLAREPFRDELKRLLNRHLPETLRTVTSPFSPDKLVDILVYLADPHEHRWSKEFNNKENLCGLLKVAQFLAREKAL